jgi:hypothetical protein
MLQILAMTGNCSDVIIHKNGKCELHEDFLILQLELISMNCVMKHGNSYKIQ